MSTVSVELLRMRLNISYGNNPLEISVFCFQIFFVSPAGFVFSDLSQPSDESPSSSMINSSLLQSKNSPLKRLPKKAEP